MEKFKKFIIPVIVVVVLLGVASGLYYIKGGSISKGKAAEKAINYINSNMLEAGTTASLVSAKSTSGVYEIVIKISDQEYTSYISKDGKLLFPSGTALIESTNTTAGTNLPKTDKPVVKLFVMSFCPYGNTAETAMNDVVNLLKDKVDFQLHYVIYDNYNGGGATYCLDKENKYCSMHGIQELNQDIRELCVQKYQPDKLWSFVLGVNNACGVGNVATCWEGVAQTTGVDVNKIKTCQKNEATALLAQEVQLNEQYGISGSPQTVINDVEYSGNRTSEGYKTAVCSAFNTQPGECSQTLQSATSGTTTGGCE